MEMFRHLPSVALPTILSLEIEICHTKKSPSGWNNVAHWYDGWVGEHGSHFHQKIAIPTLLAGLDLDRSKHILDIGCGSGVLAPHIARSNARYTGIDISRKLIQKARKYHNQHGEFKVCDARKLRHHLPQSSYDSAVFLLSIQDMNPLNDVIQNASYVLRDGGTLVILMTHPCFRIPRQSGWGYEKTKKLQYRRIDRYLTPLKIPMKQHKQGVTISFHRPLSAYINTLATHNFAINKLDEITTYASGNNKAERRANDEIPLFMLIRAMKY